MIPDGRTARDKLDLLARQLASAGPTRPFAPAQPRPFIAGQTGKDAKPDVAAALQAIDRAADLMGSRQQQLTASERRAAEQDERIETLARQLAQTETRLRQTLDDLGRETARATDLERRSTELLDKTQEMLTEASDRLVTAERRAQSAEDSLDQLQALIMERLRF